MCYFTDFKSKLHDKHKGDFSSLMGSGFDYDVLKGRRVRGFRELDSRKQKETGYVKVYVEPVVVVEDPPPVEEVDEVKFEVIDLDAEMERRRKSTEANNPVQPDATTESKPFSMTTRSASKSPRGLVSPSQADKGIKVVEQITGGNRHQRRAAKAIVRKKANKVDKGKWKTVRGNSGGSPETPKVVKLSDLDMGIRWE
uniref:Uncharacterized protein n=1 Tax=Pseudomonas phage RVTF4 TaxID=3236931 RepID=A0AB39CD41_9VIRU